MRPCLATVRHITLYQKPRKLGQYRDEITGLVSENLGSIYAKERDICPPYSVQSDSEANPASCVSVPSLEVTLAGR